MAPNPELLNADLERRRRAIRTPTPLDHTGAASQVSGLRLLEPQSGAYSLPWPALSTVRGYFFGISNMQVPLPIPFANFWCCFKSSSLHRLPLQRLRTANSIYDVSSFLLRSKANSTQKGVAQCARGSCLASVSTGIRRLGNSNPITDYDHITLTGRSASEARA